MALSVRILGCSGSYSGPGEPCSGYLVESPGARVWLDAGPGTFANLQRHCRVEDLSAVVVSHEHPDHWLDLAMAFVACRYYVSRPPLVVYGTAGTLDLARRLAGAWDLAPTIDWRTISDGAEATIGDQHWRFSRTDHPVETMAPRVDSGGRSFAYSADTGADWSFAGLGTGMNLALCEATYIDDHKADAARHLSAGMAGAMAAEAGVARLVLTHLPPGADAGEFARQAAEAFGHPTEVARQGHRYTV